MPLIGDIAVQIFTSITTIITWIATARLRPKLQGRQPCNRWFVCCVATVAAATVFTIWTGVWGLGAAEPGLSGAAFGLFGGLIWGGIFALINSFVLWRAFDSPSRDYEAEKQDMMNTDVGALVSRLLKQILSFRPAPEFANTGVLPWMIFVAAVILSMLWAFAFCLLTYVTEGAPGTEPVIPVF